jgi:phage tail-like protein
MADVQPNSNGQALTIAHAADFYRRYPGETIRFYTRVEVHEDLADLTLKIGLPPGMVLEGYGAPQHQAFVSPEIEVGLDYRRLVWQVGQKVTAGSCYEYQAEVRVACAGPDLVLESRAAASAKTSDEKAVAAEETVSVAVQAKGRYLKHLPALYQEDDLMGRFLMLFESFWDPIEQQLDHIPFYFDPKMTTPDFLNWLASWIDLVLDERWPEEKRRRLISAAASLYRKRGTKRGLEEYLEIYTGEKPQIIEHRAENFRLGPKARLGPGIALGSHNLPHTFDVILYLPPIPLTEEGEEERIRQEQLHRRTIEAIIEAGKPAHTSYTLHLEPLPA